MDDIVKHLRTKAKHKAHQDNPQDDCPLCTPVEEELTEEDDIFDLLNGEDEEAPAPDKKADRLNRIMSN